MSHQIFETSGECPSPDEEVANRMEDAISVGLYIYQEDLRERIHAIVKAAGINTRLVEDPMEAASWRVLITDKEPLQVPKDRRKLRVNSETKNRELLRRIRLLVRVPRFLRRVVVGIDPGKRIGVAAFSGTRLIDVLETDDQHEVMIWLSELIDVLQPKQIKIRIGSGQRWRQIRNTVRSSLGDKVIIELVDERRTTKGQIGRETRFGKDVEAAIQIALKR